jgi:ABC-2 type transport system ATP-binding protein
MKPEGDIRSGVLARLVGVEKRYGETVALNGLDLQVRGGELLAVLGPNGAGKTTAIALMLGLQTPDKGEARLFDRSPHDLAARRGVGVMMQEVALADALKVRDHIAMTQAYYPDPLTLQEAITLAGVEKIANRPYLKLSGGQKRQAQFALAICGRPRLLFLDEPTTGLDLNARENMWATLRRLVAGGTSIVLTTHYIEEAEALADRVVVMAKGREVAADPALKDLEVRRAGLSEAFAELTQEPAE